MKLRFIYTFAVLMLGISSLSAQALCQPDPIYTDTVGVFPPPFEEELTPDGGITTAACIGEAYEFVLTAVIGDTLDLGGLPIVLDSLIILSVDGLPAGLQTACNPGSCVVTAADTAACLIIYGTPDETNEPGTYPLVLNAKIFSGGINLDLTFPNAAIAPGTYDLTLNEAGACAPSGVNELSSTGMSLTFAPNPMSAYGVMEIAVDVADKYDYVVYNLLGQIVHQEQLNLQVGGNIHNVEVQNLPKGVYVHTIQNDTKRITKRLIVN